MRAGNRVVKNRVVKRSVAVFAHVAAITGLLGCGDDGLVDSPLAQSCDLLTEFLADGGVARDGIPALTDPPMVAGLPVTQSNGYVLPGDRVVGLIVDGRVIAIPHNVLWTHEIVNLNIGDLQLAVTYCPLTGSALVFDRSNAGGAEFGVSGLLYFSNLMMFDRSGEDSLWPQMLGEARCGSRSGVRLERYPAVEMNWARWLTLHPESEVVSGAIDPFGNYRSYPYGNYESLGTGFFFPMPRLDERRLPKERVLGIPAGAISPNGIAFPFFSLNDLGEWGVVPIVLGGQDLVVLWDRNGVGAMVFRRAVAGAPIDLEATADGIFDVATGSRFDVDGVSREGPLAGAALEPVTSAYVAFWGAWSAFFPDTQLWTVQGVS